MKASTAPPPARSSHEFTTSSAHGLCPSPCPWKRPNPNAPAAAKRWCYCVTSRRCREPGSTGNSPPAPHQTKRAPQAHEEPTTPATEHPGKLHPRLEQATPCPRGERRRKRSKNSPSRVRGTGQRAAQQAKNQASKANKSQEPNDLAKSRRESVQEENRRCQALFLEVGRVAIATGITPPLASAVGAG